MELYEPGHIKRTAPLGGEKHIGFRVGEVHGRITKTRGYVSNILMALSHAPQGLEAFAAFGEYARYAYPVDSTRYNWL